MFKNVSLKVKIMTGSSISLVIMAILGFVGLNSNKELLNRVNG